MPKVESRKKRRTVVIYPGDPLPAGVYVNGWKLDLSNRNNKPRGLYLILEDGDSDAEALERGAAC